MTSTTTTRSAAAAADVAALLRARNPVLWVVSREEARVERYLIEAAAAAGYVPRTWDVAQGVCDLAGRTLPVPGLGPNEILESIKLAALAEPAERGAWILRDLPAWLEGLSGAADRRRLRNLARTLPGTPRDRAQAVIVVSPSADVPADLANHVTVIDWPQPDRAEIAAILDSVIQSLPDDLKATAAPNGTRDAAIDAAVGLSAEEASACYAKSLVKVRRIDPATVAAEKKRVISRERVLEWFDPLPGGLDAVGGLELLKGWLVARRDAYSAKAREYGLPAPKGVLLVGVPGCGKSLTAKAIATAFGCPLLKIDLGALKSKFVGESESNLRRAFATIQAIGRCVVWIDEVEKALAGATQGAADGGVSSDALGAILSWMQERQGAAFVIATANDVDSLPPELLRKGRFDDLFFVDLPTAAERAAIARTALATHGRAAVAIDCAAVATVTANFSGAEIASLVPDALYAAFADAGREIATPDLIAAAGRVVPLAKTAAEKIARLRKWAEGRARPASVPETAATAAAGRRIDL